MNNLRPVAVLALSFGVVTLACLTLTPNAASLTPEIQPPPTKQPQPLSAQPTPPPAVPPSEPTLFFAPTVATQELSPSGPWVVFTNDAGIWAVNEDGTGLTLVSPDLPVFRTIVPAPSGGRLAYVIGSPPPYGHVTLHVFSLPERKEIASIPLTTETTEPEPGPERGPKNEAVEAAVGNTEQPNMAWSADGRNLAFVGVTEGDTADVYMYSADTGEVTRLSSGPSQAYAPSWSPDGKYIVHLGAETFGTGAGYDMAGIWAAQSDGSKAIALENVNLGNGPGILGWDGDEPAQFYLTAWGPDCGGYDLQKVDVETGKVKHLWEGVIRAAALNPSGRQLILAAAEGCGDTPAVVHVLPSEDTWIEPDVTPSEVKWLEETRSGHTAAALALTSQGEFLYEHTGVRSPMVSPAAQVGLPVQAPGADTILWAGDGLWMGDLTNFKASPVQIFQGVATSVMASEGAEHLLIFTEGKLWVASASDGYLPVPVAEVQGGQGAVRVVQ